MVSTTNDPPIKPAIAGPKKETTELSLLSMHD